MTIGRHSACLHCQIGLPKQQQYRKKRINRLRKTDYHCHHCKRQSVERAAEKAFKREDLLESLLLERISLRGIARILKGSLTWIVGRAKQLWQSVPEELPTGQLSNRLANRAELYVYCLEADEMWRSADVCGG